MLLSIVVLTHNSHRRIEACLSSLRDTITIQGVECIVVDNASTDSTLQIVEHEFPFVKVIANAENLGVAKARNMGIRQSIGKYVLLIDDDTQALSGSVDGLCDYLDKHPECGLVGPQLLNPDGTIQSNALEFPSVLNKLSRIATKLMGGRPKYLYLSSVLSGKPFMPGYLIGACQLVRRDALFEVGLLDEKIFYGPEDADLCIKLNNKGYQVVCLPMFRIIHDYQQLSYKQKNIRLMLLHLKGLFHFWIKHWN